MEKDSKIQMPARQVNRSDLHADSTIARTAIPRRFHGASPESVESFSGEHEEDWSDPQEQFHNKHKQQSH